ncbi:MAG: four helix bundle protein [Candidatus Levyibacteriota bacterium]
MNDNKIHSFTDLNAWKEGHRLVLEVYKISKNFPQEERFGLVDQVRRASVSVTSNIAEGFSRKTKKEKAQFLFTSLGSLTEVQNQLLIARDLGYLDNKEFKEIADKTIIVSKLINGLIKSANSLNS